MTSTQVLSAVACGLAMLAIALATLMRIRPDVGGRWVRSVRRWRQPPPPALVRQQSTVGLVLGLAVLLIGARSFATNGSGIQAVFALGGIILSFVGLVLSIRCLRAALRWRAHQKNSSEAG
jgi:hypothetical protein